MTKVQLTAHSNPRLSHLQAAQVSVDMTSHQAQIVNLRLLVKVKVQGVEDMLQASALVGIARLLAKLLAQEL